MSRPHRHLAVGMAQTPEMYTIDTVGRLRDACRRESGSQDAAVSADGSG